jgi:glutamate N-acetyltransferase/amino-acid N-acetyltransferase
MTRGIDVIPQGTITSPEGFTAGAAYGGLGKHALFGLDVGILLSQAPCTAAGVFTQNQIKSAPVRLCQKHLEMHSARAVIANSGCANAGTGTPGTEDALAMAEIAAVKTGVKVTEVLVASTGVIGSRLPVDLIRQAADRIEFTPHGGHLMARAIVTTDTAPKETAVRAGGFVIGGIAKGAGMIHPNLATMLCFLTTDARIDADLLTRALKTAVDKSLNMISVDGDTSPNDTVLLLANGLSGQKITESTSDAALFQEALDTVCISLAKAIARDGEGATKLMEIVVRGAKTTTEARSAARAIVSSNLVKAAIHGADPNWGRIVAAAGQSLADIEESKLALAMCGVPVMRDGIPLDFDRRQLSALLKRDEIVVELDLMLGEATATAWGCDLSAEYVAINADYTT